MYFTGVKASSINQKDIGAFYGVNRTNKINDYQMSDMKNMDCENFPYLATRRERKLFYNANKMAAICHDTDITNDYKVTGVTKDGSFVYRGSKVVSGGLSALNSVSECLGDYMLLPQKKYIRINSFLASDGLMALSANVNDFPKPAGDVKCEYCSEAASLTSSGFYGSVGKYVNVASSRIYCDLSTLNKGLAPVNAFVSGFFRLRPGMAFRLKLMARNGNFKNTKPEITNEYVCDIPDDVYMVVDQLQINVRTSSGVVAYVHGNKNFNESVFRDITYGDNTAIIAFTARREKTGELYDISRHFRYYKEKTKELSSDTLFCAGMAYYNLDTPSANERWWNDLYILPEAPIMLFGAFYNGRFFACDNVGVDVFYSSSSNRSNFVSTTSVGGAGSVQCADHGRWTALISYGGALYAFKKNGMYRIYSSDGLSFYMDKVCDVGAVSQKAVCVVSDVMYFLSETGLYRFTGTYPEELPDNLGRHYTDGILGGYDNKVYCSLVYSGGTELVVYDAQVNAYGIHDAFKASGFVTYGGKLYGLNSADGHVYEMSGERKPVQFSINTRRFFVGFEKKAVNGIRIYFDFSGGENEKIEVFVSYDGGAWEPCFKPITSGRLKYVPIKFKKCDELCVKIQGNGVFTLKGMTLSFYSGGDIKQNK